jgi:AcrR family transcriptional regulator
VRDITKKARANVASVNYHFGSKTDLIRAVIVRRARPLNEHRLRLLDEAEAKGEPTLEQIMRAFLAPVFKLWREAPEFIRLIGRVETEPKKNLMDFFLKEMHVAVVRFKAALTRALPDTPVEDLFWRMLFVIGAMCHVAAGAEKLEQLSGGLCKIGDGEHVLERLLVYATAGLAAPGYQGEKK